MTSGQDPNEYSWRWESPDEIVSREAVRLLDKLRYGKPDESREIELHDGFYRLTLERIGAPANES